MANSGVLAPLKSLFPDRWFAQGPVIPVLRIAGPIGAITPLRQGITLGTMATAIERAFSYKDAPAVALLINSPGGSPVQSRLIYQRIRALAQEKSVKVFVFAEDVAASGGYLIALAGDEIYADASSIVGSIGVLAASFGLHRLIEKIGVERRVYTAGDKKMMLDPFQPEKEDDVARLERIQRIVHQDFIDLVRERRGKKIEDAGEQLFTGEFWSGRQALELGLIDGLADVRSKMRELYGEEVQLRLVSPERGLFFRRSRGVGVRLTRGDYGLGETPGFADELISAIEARALWARFGL